jgi:hypothetical protein
LEKTQKHVLNMENMYQLYVFQCFKGIPMFCFQKPPLCPMTSTSGSQCFKLVYGCLSNIWGGTIFSIGMVFWKALKESFFTLGTNTSAKYNLYNMFDWPALV